MKYLSVCSGIEAASVAFEPLGWEPVAFSEIDAFPAAVLKHRFPNVPNWGDMNKYESWPDVSVGIICGGTPCQSFSVAGLRKGLDDARGNLMLTFGHILAKYRPTWFIWENVPGVLSSDDGRDFASFLGLVTGQIIEPPEDGWRNTGCISGIDSAYGIAYRVLDAQYTRSPEHPRAVPQRRRRVFVVGHLGDWRRAAAVLLDSESLSGNPSPRREAGQRVALGVTSGPPFSRTGNERIEAEAMVVTGSHWDGDNAHPTLSQSLRTSGGIAMSDQELFSQRGAGLVAHSLSAEGFDASEDGTGRGTPIVCVSSGQANAETSLDHSPALTCLHEAPIVVLGGMQDHQTPRTDGASPCLPSAMGEGGGHIPIVAIQGTIIGRSENAGPQGSGTSEDGVMFTLTKTDQHAIAIKTANTESNGSNINEDGVAYTLDRANGQAVAFQQNTRDEVRLMDGDGGIAGCLSAEPGMKQQNYVAQPIAWSEELTASVDVGPTILHGGQGGRHDGVMTPQMAVRRLTPVECEKLQGFPQDWTNVPWRKGTSPDGPRYKSIGNSMATNCMEWIGLRIQMVEDAE